MRLRRVGCALRETHQSRHRDGFATSSDMRPIWSLYPSDKPLIGASGAVWT